MTPEQFLTFADSLPEPMLLVLSSGLVLAGNRAVEKRLGIALDEVRGTNLSDVVSDSREEVVTYLRSCARTRSLVPGSLTLLPNGDEALPCRAEGTLLQARNETSEPVLLLRLFPKETAVGQFMALNLRIDELNKEVRRRKHAEAVAWQQAQELRVTLQSIGDGVIVTDVEGRVTLLNPVAEAMTGWTLDEASGKPLPLVFQIVNEDTRQPVDNPALRALAQGTIVGLANHTLLISKTGTEWPIDDCAAPIRGEGEKIIGSVLVFRDISERKATEKALRDSEGKLKILADTIPQMAWMARSDGSIFWYNRRWYEYSGTTLEQMEGWGWQSLHDPEMLPKVQERWMKSIASGEPFEMVFPIKGSDQTFRPFLTRVNPFRDENGHILYWLGTNTDISDIKRMEEALRDADRRKDEFLATLAHELRNPLAPIHNSLQILKLPKVKEATFRQVTEMMERQVHHLVRLVDDLLDVSRVTRGKIEMRKEAVDLTTVIARAVETIQPLIAVHKHRLNISIPDDPFLLHADPVRLCQAVANLLTNAVKYTEPGGNIWLSAVQEFDHVVLTVRDSGIGISPEMLPHVFDLFFQVDHTTTKTQGGLGIGLTLVKNLIELHGGTVEAFSSGTGQGCEFVVRLPLMHGESRQSQVVGNGTLQDPPPGPQNLRLLIVDDNRDAAISMAMLLRLRGYEVQVAHSGSAAFEVLETYLPDAVFLDIGMPGMDGFEAARRLRQQPRLKNLLLIALTGWGQQEDRRRTAEAGFDHHLVKPPKLESVEHVLAQLKMR